MEIFQFEKLLTPQDLQLSQTFNEISGVIMFDGMAIVNKMKKTDAMRTCNDFVYRLRKPILQTSSIDFR